MNTGTDYSFGNWVRRRRKALDLTQRELAQRIGCSASAIIKIESDARRPSQQIAELLAEQLEIQPEQRSLFLKVARREKGDKNLESLPLTPVPGPGETALPVAPTPIIGRDHELRVIAQQIRDPACRLLTLTGPGGVGKTRLALEAAHQLREEFQHRVYFVSLVGTRAPEFIVSAIADSIGLTFHTNEPTGELLNFLREKRLLLVLDNLEQLLDGVELLTRLLENAPDLRILATSRGPLGLRSEWALAVQGLPIPASTDLETLESNSAAALFLRRCRQSRVGFTLAADEVDSLRRICELVEGLPLGLELAATWVRTLACREIAQEIERSMDFLRVSARDVPERHRSIRAVFDSSWNLLSEAERCVLLRLCVFRGGFTRQAAEQVAGATLHLLSSLVDKSLVRQSDVQAGRYDLHELTRQYAHEQLQKSDQAEDAHNQHLEFFVKLVEEVEAKLRGPEEVLWLNRLEHDLDNLRGALEWSLRYEGADQDAAAEKYSWASLRLAGGLHFFWKRKSHWSEGRSWLRRALEQSARLPATLDRAGALNAAALLAVEQSDTRAARQLAEENLALARQLGEPYPIACALNTLGLVLWKQKNHAEARARCEEALALFREIGNAYATADALHSLGHIAVNQDDLEAAQTYLEEALTIAGESNLKIGLVDVLGDLGLVAYLQEHFATAGGYLNESLRRFREADNVSGIESSLNRLGDLARCQGEYEHAHELYEEALALFQEMGDKDETASLLHNLGCVSLQRGDHTRALEMFRQALAIQNEMGNQAGIAECLAGAGSVFIAQGHAERGARLLGAAEGLREATASVLWPANRVEYDRTLDCLRAAMDEAALTAAWVEGRGLSVEEAVAEAHR